MVSPLDCGACGEEVIEAAAHDFYHLTPKVLESMLAFLDGKSVPDRIVLPFDLRGPDERREALVNAFSVMFFWLPGSACP